MKIRSFSNFDEFMAGDDDSYATHLKNINGLIPAKEEDFTVPGFSFPANQFVDFHVDFNYGPGFPEVNWRERLVCPITGLNNRVRAATMMIEFFGNVDATSNIYINEQTTPLFNFLQKSYPRIVGSEFLGDTYASGSINELGIRHEDATALSFETESQHLVLSFEV